MTRSTTNSHLQLVKSPNQNQGLQFSNNNSSWLSGQLSTTAAPYVGDAVNSYSSGTVTGILQPQTYIQPYVPPPITPTVIELNRNWQNLMTEKFQQLNTLYPPTEMLKGEGFLVIPTDPTKVQVQHLSEIEKAADAQDRAVALLDTYGAIVIYQAVGIVRPKKDYVLKLSTAGAAFQDAIEKAEKALPAPAVEKKG